MDMDGWWMVWGTIMMLGFWGGLIAVAVWAVRSFVDRGREPIEIARQRYAKGEITSEEFEQLRDRLRRTA